MKLIICLFFLGTLYALPEDPPEDPPQEENRFANRTSGTSDEPKGPAKVYNFIKERHRITGVMDIRGGQEIKDRSNRKLPITADDDDDDE